MSASELWRLTANQAVGLLKRGEVSPIELIDAAAVRTTYGSPIYENHVPGCGRSRSGGPARPSTVIL